MELLERFAQGEIDAFEVLFREFQRDVYAWIVRIVRDPNAAEDLTVEAFWRMYRAHARFDPRHKSRSRAFRERQAGLAKAAPPAESQANAQKSESAEPSRPRQWDAHAGSDPDGSFGAWARRIATNLALDHLKRARRELPLIIEPSEGTTANPAVQREMREQIEGAFRALSPKLHAVATLALVEEVPYDDIAEALGISVMVVRVRVFRAVRILREQLADELKSLQQGVRGDAAQRATAAQRQ